MVIRKVEVKIDRIYSYVNEQLRAFSESFKTFNELIDFQ